jgi:hypothetical protein
MRKDASTDADRRLAAVNRPEDIPAFRSEAEEAEFWATHSLGEAFLQRFQPAAREKATEEEKPAVPRRRRN